MCRILGIKNFNYIKHKKLLKNFLKLAEIGKTLKGDSPGHYDGWGIGYYKNGEAIVHKSGGSVIKEKNDYWGILEKIAYSKVLITHFRKSAWPTPVNGAGVNTPSNSHPFKYRNILFAHNGTIYDYKNLLKEIKLSNRSHFNGLDSEVYFLYLINYLSLGIKNAFKKSVLHIMKNNIYSSLTCIFTDGNILYAHREYSKNPDYYTLYYARHCDSGIISSEPVSPELKWKILRKGKLFTI